MKIWFVMLFLVVEVFYGNSIVCYAKESLERYSKVYDSPEEIPEPERELTGPDGVCYELRNSEIEEIYVPDRVEKTGSTLVYKGVGELEPIPQTAEITVWDKARKINLKASFPLLGTTYDRERWQDFQFRLVFHEYDSDAYMLNDIAIDAEESLTELTRRAPEIYKLIGLREDDCRISRYKWGGEPYLDNLGVLCRDVLVEGEKRVWDCSALYEGEITLPGYDRYRLKNSYFKKVADVKAPEIPPDNDPILETMEKEELKYGLSHILKVCLEVTVGLFFAILAFLGFRFLLVLIRRLGEEKEKRDA